MLTPNEYFALKRRLLLAAEAAAVICRSSQMVRWDDETFPEILHAMGMNKEDVRSILAEADVLRHMHGLPIFPRTMEEMDASHAPANDGGTLEPLQKPHHERGEQQVPGDGAGDGGEVPPRRVRKRRAKRPKPVRDRSGDGADQESLGRDNTATAVGGEQGASDEQ